MSKLGQEPTFPIDGVHASSAIQCGNTGINKRFYAACAAMQGLLANMDMITLITKKASQANINWKENLAQHSFDIADELLKQENNDNTV